MHDVVLRIYVLGDSFTSTHVQWVVKEMIDSFEGRAAHVEVVDVLEKPELSEEAGVLATPTIDCLIPPPVRRVVGAPATAAELIDSLMLGSMLTALQADADGASANGASANGA